MSTASAYLTVRGIDVDVVYKDIKNLHIGVYPPVGRVRVAAPERLDDEQIRLAVIQRLPWIKRQRKQLQDAERQSRARDGDRRVPLRLGRRATGSRSSSGPAERTSRSTAIGSLLYVPPRHRHRGAPSSCSRTGTASSSEHAIPALIARWEPMIGAHGSALEHPAHEDQVGLLQPRDRPHLVQPRTRQEAPALPGVHRRPRDDAPPRAQPRRALHQAHGRSVPDWRTRRDELNSAPLAHEEWVEAADGRGDTRRG